MQCGFKVSYGYTQSDEISLLLDLKENSFGRKERKLNSILSGEASAKFSLLLGDIATFDSRICQLPNKQLVVDYLRWRHEDAHRNALNAHCYWYLRKEGGFLLNKRPRYYPKNQLLKKTNCFFKKGLISMIFRIGTNAVLACSGKITKKMR